MATSSNETDMWSPPADQQWPFSQNCSSFALFAHTILRTTEKHKLTDYCAVNGASLHSLVLALLPNGSDPKVDQVTSWYMLSCGSAFDGCRTNACTTSISFHSAVAEELTSLRNCTTELRSALQIQGNADIAGIGVRYG